MSKSTVEEPARAGLGFRDRIVELRRVPASELRRNPANWRRHPQHQVEALAAVLDEVGFADALIGRETPDGIELIDGHLRADLADETDVPVLILDVDENEARIILATLDPLAALAERDGTALAELTEAIETSNDRVRELLDAIALTPPPVDAPGEFSDPSGGAGTILSDFRCPKCSYEWNGQPRPGADAE